MRLLSHLHTTCGQDHDCNYCNRHEHLNHATPCDTHVFLGKSEQALKFTSSTRNVTSDYTIELIKLWHAWLGGLTGNQCMSLLVPRKGVLVGPVSATTALD